MRYFKIAFFFASLFFGQILPGQNLQELKKLQDEYKKVLDRQSLQKPEEISRAEKAASSVAVSDKIVYSRKEIESLLVNTQELLKKLEAYEDSIDDAICWI